MAMLKHTEAIFFFSSYTASQQILALSSSLLVLDISPLQEEVSPVAKTMALVHGYALTFSFLGFTWLLFSPFLLAEETSLLIPHTVCFHTLLSGLILIPTNISFIEEIFKHDISLTLSFFYISTIPTDAWTAGNKTRFLSCETPFSVVYKGKSTRLFPAEKTAGFRAGISSQGKTSFENCP